MKFYLVAYIALSCPGGPFARFIPESAKQFICSQKIEIKITERKDKAYAMARKAGCDSVLLRCNGFRCRSRSITCSTKLVIEGEE